MNQAAEDRLKEYTEFVESRPVIKNSAKQELF